MSSGTSTAKIKKFEITTSFRDGLGLNCEAWPNSKNVTAENLQEQVLEKLASPEAQARRLVTFRSEIHPVEDHEAVVIYYGVPDLNVNNLGTLHNYIAVVSVHTVVIIQAACIGLVAGEAMKTVMTAMLRFWGRVLSKKWEPSRIIPYLGMLKGFNAAIESTDGWSIGANVTKEESLNSVRKKLLEAEGLEIEKLHTNELRKTWLDVRALCKENDEETATEHVWIVSPKKGYLLNIWGNGPEREPLWNACNEAHKLVLFAGVGNDEVSR